MKIAAKLMIDLRRKTFDQQVHAVGVALEAPPGAEVFLLVDSPADWGTSERLRDWGSHLSFTVVGEDPADLVGWINALKPPQPDPDEQMYLDRDKANLKLLGGRK